jgi:hypothetical protein
VYAASGIWGHINVDDITLRSWKVGGSNTGCSNTGGVLPRTNSGSKQHYSGQEESPSSGTAYMFVGKIHEVCPIKSSFFGGTIIQVKDFRAQLRIDDDDWLTKNTTQFCTNRIL